MRQVQLIVRSLSAFGVATLFAACSSSGYSANNIMPSGGAAVPSSVAGASLSAHGVMPDAPAKKGQGPWGLYYKNSVYVQGGSNLSACTGIGSSCTYIRHRAPLKNALSTASADGSASLESTSALGSLSGSGKAHLVYGVPSALAYVLIGFQDTFTITSKTLPPGAPVSLTATLQVTGKFTCNPEAIASVAIGSYYSGLSFSEMCASSPPPVLTATVNTSVGASFTDGLELALDVDAGQGAPGKLNSGPFKATYHLDPITKGASYITATGTSYR
jgi:hypothetical protein